MSLHSTDSLAEDLQTLGLRAGDVVLAHSSLKRIGPVVGGAAAVVLALERVLGPEGTLVMPTFSEHLCDPKDQGNADPPDVRAFKLAHMPLYDPDLTPVDRCNGFLTEVFRRQRGVVRSAHPHVSFAAWGRHAARVVAGHGLDDGLGPQSPLGTLYELSGTTLLLGADSDALTCLHLAEYSVPRLLEGRRTWSARMLRDGKPVWVEYQEVDNNSDVFPALLDEYLSEGRTQTTGKVGDAECRLLPIVELVDFGVPWLVRNR